MHLPARPLSRVLGQVLLLNVGARLHHQISHVSLVLYLLKCSVLAINLDVSLLIGHTIQIIDGNHFEHLDVCRVLLAVIMRAVYGDILRFLLRILLLLEFFLQCELVVVLHLEVVAFLDWCHIAVIGILLAETKIVIIFFVLTRQVLVDVNAQLSIGEEALHVVNLPVAFERID